MANVCLNDDIENRIPENVLKSRLEVPKKDDVYGNKRRALATIPTNVNRIQPSRICKLDPVKPIELSGKVSALNIGKNQATQLFTIHCDDPSEEEEKLKIKTENLKSQIAVQNHEDQAKHTATSVALAALSPDESIKICEDSPMVIDESEDDKDSSFKADISYISEYASDIFRYLRETEVKFRPRPHYMRKQPDITHGMRSILIDWLIEVAEEYKLHPETLFLSVSYIDRFLSSMSVLRSKLQLVGTASMFIASKYEEIYPPDIGEFVYITDDTYTKKQVLRMEHLILKVLSFDLAVPTTSYFLHLFCCVGNIPQMTEHLAQYLCELSLLEADPYLQYLPSEIAASALSLANHTLGRKPWCEELQKYTGLQLNDFYDCIKSLHKSFANASSYPQQAVMEKYKASKFNSVSLLMPPTTLP